MTHREIMELRRKEEEKKLLTLSYQSMKIQKRKRKDHIHKVWGKRDPILSSHEFDIDGPVPLSGPKFPYPCIAVNSFWSLYVSKILISKADNK